MQFRAFAIAMPIRFRGLGRREGMLVRGDAGWGEFSPFLEYSATAGVDFRDRVAGLISTMARIPSYLGSYTSPGCVSGGSCNDASMGL